MRRLLLLALMVAAGRAPLCAAEDWPTYAHDVARSSVTSEALALPLHEAWQFRAPHPPQPAWPEPAKRDIWHEIRELHPAVIYDRAYHTVIADGMLFFGSSSDDRIYALDAATGSVRWTFFTEGPVRLAPTVFEGRVYAGSDDGCVYCLSAADGTLVWKRRIAPIDHRIPGNGRVMSLFPVRTGILVEDGVAYCCAGLFPDLGVYRCALNPLDGSVILCERTEGLSPQGYLLASPTRVFVPAGRVNPAVFARDGLRPLGTLPGPGGTFAIIMGDTLLTGPGRRTGQIDVADPQSNESIATYEGLRMVVKGDITYLQSKTHLSALDRASYIAISQELKALQQQREEKKKELDRIARGEVAGDRDPVAAALRQLDAAIREKSAALAACERWRLASEWPYAMILAGEVLFAGGEGKTAAINAANGEVLWTSAVSGDAYGLSAANGALYVSTNAGTIHCFQPAPAEREHVVAFVADRLSIEQNEAYPVCEAAARAIIQETGISQGYCLNIGCGSGLLAYALAKHSDLKVIAVDEDAARIAEARAALAQAGVYGTRVSLHEAPLSDLPYTGCYANLIVSERALLEGQLPPSPAEVARILRPEGGMAVIGQAKSPRRAAPHLTRQMLNDWANRIETAKAEPHRLEGQWAVLRRGALPGIGEWTQLYSNESHTACSMDQLEGPMTVQWFGEPGPREIIDRHHRPMSPLSKHGRVFVPADDLVIALDAYNGTTLWRTPVPNSRRVGALKNSGHMILTDDLLYVVKEAECWALDPATGERRLVLNAPQPGDGPRDWGYVNRVDDTLIGTLQKRGASFTMLHKDTINTLEGDFRPVIVSDSMFAMDRHTGSVLWEYRSGIIMNNGITVGNGCVHFVESRNEKALSNEDGRMRIDEFCAGDVSIKALDLASGDLLWEQPYSFPLEHIMFASCAEGILLITGTYNKDNHPHYGLFAFDGATGAPKWQNSFVGLDIRGNEPGPTEGSHGEQWQHPVIVGKTVYLRPYGFNLETGEQLPYIARRGGHGCGGLTGSARYLYGRGNNPRMYPLDVAETEGIPLTEVSRPGCWLNIIAVGGMVLIPESSSGCTCAYPLQTSFGLTPRALSGLDL